MFYVFIDYCQTPANYANFEARTILFTIKLWYVEFLRARFPDPFFNKNPIFFFKHNFQSELSMPLSHLLALPENKPAWKERYANIIPGLMLGTLRFFFFFAGRDVNGRKYLDRQPYSPRPSFPFLPLDPPDAGLVKPFGTHRFQQLEECKPSLHPRSFLHFTPRPPEPPCPPEIKDIYFMKEK